jgi:hypothetical protein
VAVNAGYRRAAAALIALLTAVGLMRTLSETVLFTSTTGEAPTFWQRRGGDIAIAVVVAAMFYLLGLLTAHQ